MNRKANREPDTPEALGLGSHRLDVPAHEQMVISGVDSLHRDSLRRVVETLFVKPTKGQ